MTTTDVHAPSIGPPAAHEAAEVAALVATLVDRAGLPPDGVHELEELLVARADERVVGAIGLEVFGDDGLVRSLAVAPEHRGSGLGSRLAQASIGRAAELGLRRLFLLTHEAPFFARLGFEDCERSAVPASLAASTQFTSDACGAARCMVLALEGGEALQDRYPGNHCFGCGPSNRRGLRLKSHRFGDACVARFSPSPEHNAGPEAWLNGGIVATLLDCHGVFAAIADAYAREEREFASAPLIWYVTGSLSVRYERPTPIDREARLVARVRSVAGRKTTVDCSLQSGGLVCATGTVLAVRVEEGWKSPPG